MAPRILFFSIAMGADYSFYVKFIATFPPTFLEYNNSVWAIVIFLWQSRKLDFEFLSICSLRSASGIRAHNFVIYCSAFETEVLFKLSPKSVLNFPWNELPYIDFV